MAEFLDHQIGRIGIQRLRDGRHHAELHQSLDHVAGTRGHPVGQFLHRDRVWQNNVAHHLHLIRSQKLQFGLAALAFALTSYRGQRADAFVLALDRSLDVDAASTTAAVRTLLRDGDLRLARHHDAAGAADRPCLVVFLRRPRAGPQTERLGGRRRRGDRRGRSATRLLGSTVGGRIRGLCGDSRLGSLACSLLGFRPRRFLGLALGILFGGSARLFLASACLLSGRQDRDLLLLAPLGLPTRILTLLLDERTLTCGLLRRRQRARYRGGRCATTGGSAACSRRRCARRGGPRRGATCRRTRCADRGALFAHFDLDDLRPAVAEALPHGTRIDRAAELEASRGP